MSESYSLSLPGSDAIRNLGENAAPALMQRDPVVFPYCLAQIMVEEKRNLLAVEKAMEKERLVAIFSEAPDISEFNAIPEKCDLRVFDFDHRRFGAVGTLARVVKSLTMPDGSVQLLVRGLRRIVSSSLELTPFGLLARFFPEEKEKSTLPPEELEAHRRSLLLEFQELAALLPNCPDELQAAVTAAPTPGRMADLIADSLNFSYAEKLVILEQIETDRRIDLLTKMVNRELVSLKTGMKIQSEVQETIGRQQREMFLREQLRSIQQELGEEYRNPDLVALHERVEKSDLPEAVAAVVKKELERMELIPTNAPEYHISYTYVTWLLDIPWKIHTPDTLDIAAAAQVLEEDHFGLKDVKERILEFLAVLQLRKEDETSRAPVLCLVGPPGVGKTSLGRSIARTMGRNFVRASLGGVRDEAEIRGHRRTYVGAMPGRIVQSLKKAGSNNPVFMLDELDKLAHDFRGDPASALLEVLDPSQNSAFNDHYIELDCDLSKVFFVATANSLENIPGPLRDRMEIITLPGYTALEKREIARRYLVKRQLKECGLPPKQISFRINAIDEIIRFDTREAGVRELERVIGRVLRRIARKFVEKKYREGEKVSVTPALVRELLGPRTYLDDALDRTGKPGCANGLAWTGCGGVTLPVEAIILPEGKGNLKLTGSLGKVMQESAETAFSLVRSRAAKLNLAEKFFNEHDFHIHVPDGATPKDGPSAGVTMTLALTSLLAGKPIRPRLAMTGEINLRGEVTAIGGVREKTIAALAAGATLCMLPEDNRKDAAELPQEVREKLPIVFVKNVDEALEIAFPDPVKPKAKKKKHERG